MKRIWIIVIVSMICGIGCCAQESKMMVIKKAIMQNGSYSEDTKNADGSITTVSYSSCHICHGSGTCTICNGLGGRWGGYGAYRRYVICVKCGGLKHCTYCQGTGVSVFKSTFYPKTQMTVGEDVWSGETFISGGSGDDTHSSTTHSHSCSSCNGTGVDPTPWKDPVSNAGNGPWAYTNPSGSVCPYCKLIIWHQHQKCPMCNVR